MKPNTCKACKGDGVFFDDEENEYPCSKCDGTGIAELDFGRFDVPKPPDEEE